MVGLGEADQQVHPLLLQLLQQLHRAADAGVQHRFRVQGGELGEDAAEQGLGEVLDHPHPHRPGQGPAGDRADRPVVEGQHLAGVLQQGVAGGRQHQPAALAVEQGLLQHLLQPLHLQAQRRLGEEHPFGGLQHRAGVDDGDEAAKDVDGQAGRHRGRDPSYEYG